MGITVTNKSPKSIYSFNKHFQALQNTRHSAWNERGYTEGTYVLSFNTYHASSHSKSITYKCLIL